MTTDCHLPTYTLRKVETAYIIRDAQTGKSIEAHDELSREWGQQTVETHNKLYPADQWVMTEEQL